MLSQRTIGKLQALLEQMFHREIGGCALTPNMYTRLLYEANVPSEVLDYIAEKCEWRPGVFVRAFHEGKATAYIRYSRSGDRVVTTADLQAGDTYLLTFASVALQRWAELCSENYFWAGNLYSDAATDLLESLEEDGFRWDRQCNCILGLGRSQPIVPPLTLVHPPEHPAPESIPNPKEQDDIGLGKASSPRSQGIKNIILMLLILPLGAIAWLLRSSAGTWSRSDILTAAAVFLGYLAVVANWLVVPELRQRLRLEKNAAVDPRDSDQSRA